jgi:hypothetical protein
VGLMLQSLFMRTGSSRAVRSAELDQDSLYGSALAQNEMIGTLPARRTGPLTYSRGDFEVTPIPLMTGDSSVGLGLFGRF